MDALPLLCCAPAVAGPHEVAGGSACVRGQHAQIEPCPHPGDNVRVLRCQVGALCRVRVNVEEAGREVRAIPVLVARPLCVRRWLPRPVRLLPAVVDRANHHEPWAGLRHQELEAAFHSNLRAECQMRVRCGHRVAAGLHEHRPNVNAVDVWPALVALVDVPLWPHGVHGQRGLWGRVIRRGARQMRQGRVPVHDVEADRVGCPSQVLRDEAATNKTGRAHRALPGGVLLATKGVVAAVGHAAVVR
mmetsp:Transcript_79175/g.223887  ORF Transcript_79175/g.223887 Transcript_79175/m.223887 type:complete len:246 (+) Transcript_79175:212-949(+)